MSHEEREPLPLFFMIHAQVRDTIQNGTEVKVFNKTKQQTYITHHFMTERELKQMLAGGLINLMKQK